ncbi:hypothetical protein ACS0TY_030751 [Phlomoides rotata]
MKGKALSTGVSASNHMIDLSGFGHEVFQGIPVGVGGAPTILPPIPTLLQSDSIPLPNQENMWNYKASSADDYSVVIPGITCIFWRIKKRKNEKCEESKPSCTGVPRQGPASSGSQRPDTDRRVPSPLSLSLLQPYFLMSKTRSYAQILIGSRLFLTLTTMAIHLSLRVAPLDLQQGGNSRIPYVHVPAARMSILVYIATAINTLLFLLTKHPLFLRSSGTGTEMAAFSTLFTLVTGGFRGRPMWGTFWVWDARLTSVLISFLIYLGALCFQKLSVELAPISIRAGPIDIPIIKSLVNWWNTSHQPGRISRSGTSIHIPMPIPILSNFAKLPLINPYLVRSGNTSSYSIFSRISFKGRNQIEAREGIPKPSSLAESLCIHG